MYNLKPIKIYNRIISYIILRNKLLKLTIYIYKKKEILSEKVSNI